MPLRGSSKCWKRCRRLGCKGPPSPRARPIPIHAVTTCYCSMSIRSLCARVSLTARVIQDIDDHPTEFLKLSGGKRLTLCRCPEARYQCQPVDCKA